MQEELFLTLLTKKELAEVLKISEVSVNRYLTQGMPHIKVGRNVRFQLEEVLEWFKKRGE